MLKRHQGRIALIAIMIFSLVAMYGFYPFNGLIKFAKAGSLYSVKDTISDSDKQASSSHAIVFSMSTALGENEYVEVSFQTGFTNFASAAINCPANTTASTTSASDDYRVLRCKVDAGQSLAVQPATHTITIYNLLNPNATGDKDVTVTTYDNTDTVKDETVLKVYIIDDVTVRATVDATLTFTVSGLGPYSTKSTVNGIGLSGTSTAEEINFGTLHSNASTTFAQNLTVSTNATAGFIVTVQKDQDLQNAAGATINSFNNSPDGTGSTTPGPWSDPGGVLESPNTYGHWGLTSDDDDAADNLIMTNDYYQGEAYYVGTDGTDPTIVMAHVGPADGSTQNIGMAAVAYSVRISDLQEAGDYSTILTYVCTPTY